MWVQQQELMASDGAERDVFGYSIALSGATLVLGAFGKASGQGAAYVFVRSGVHWSQQQALTASDGGPGDWFGGGVALDGDVALVGAWQKAAGRGAAYVFVRSGGSWAQQQVIVASDGEHGDCFGGSMALSGDTAVVGAFGRASGQGAAYVFVRSGGSWSQSQVLTASDGAENDAFGISVALSEDTLIVGARKKASARGAAYVFVRSGDSWAQKQVLTASDGAAGDEFGVRVSLSGDTAIVSTLRGGGAYVFVRSGASWSLEQKLASYDPLSRGPLGGPVALSEDTAIVGSPQGGRDGCAAHVFVRSGSSWSLRQVLTAADAESRAFGNAVVVSGDTAVVGAHGLALDPGAAYVFVLLGAG